MDEDVVKLWSLHEPTHSLTAGEVDHALSQYVRETPGCVEAYERLWNEIGELDGQVIWCSTTSEGIPKTGIKKTLWYLEVAPSRVICRVNNIAWNKILGISRIALPRGFRDECNRQPIEGDWWKELISFEEHSGLLWSALIRHPVSPSEVVEKREWVTGETRRS